jgi:hypothetical protein
MVSHKDLEAAIQILERHPRFAHAQIKARDRMEELEKAHATIRTYTPQERLELVLRRLDARAEPSSELVTDIEKQNAFIDHLESWGDLAWIEYAGGPPDVVRPATAQDQRALRAIQLRMEFWVKAGYQQVVNAGSGQTSSLENRQAGDGNSNASERTVVISANSPQAKRYPRSRQQATGWDEVTIWLVSDFQLEIQIGREREVYNYADLGLEDRRTQQPNEVWRTLVFLAESKGNIRHPGGARNWGIMEKRVQKLREFLRHFFNVVEDPLPFAEGNGYRALFTISLRRSYSS